MKSTTVKCVCATLAIAAMLAAAPSGIRAQGKSATDGEGIAETPPVPAAKIPAYIKAAVDAPGRPASDRELDAGRKPEQILAFFAIKPGMKVADLWAAGGWTTELLSHTVGPTGKVYSQNAPFPPRFKKAEELWHSRLKRLKNVVEVDRPFDAPNLLPVPPNSLDAVIIQENYHDMVGRKMDVARINSEVFDALKPGGEYCIVDHSAKPGTGASDTTTLHRIDERLVIDQVEKAGFKLAAASSALRHPEDDRTWLVFKHRGQTDRFMLKFVKPK
jgi:predicted methyltransferase